MDKAKDLKNNEEIKKDDKKSPQICNDTDALKQAPATDVYGSTECQTEDAKVDIPTEEAVEQAKEWVEDENRK